LISTLCGIEGSLLANSIWKAWSDGALSSVGSKAMLRAETWATVAAPDGAALSLGADEAALGAAEGDGAAEADGAPEADADGATDPLASAEGTAVGDGAGAYVQPGVDEAQAATARMVMTAASRRIDGMSG
jgi:hypothetical protein